MSSLRLHQLLLRTVQSTSFSRGLSMDTLMQNPCLPCPLLHLSGHVSSLPHAIYTPLPLGEPPVPLVCSACPPRSGREAVAGAEGPQTGLSLSATEPR